MAFQKPEGRHSLAQRVSAGKCAEKNVSPKRAKANDRYRLKNVSLVAPAIRMVSPSRVADVQRYIRNQAEHHKKRNFEQEFVSLIRKSGIPFEEKYVFG
jgi:hypothetical protein